MIIDNKFVFLVGNDFTDFFSKLKRINYTVLVARDPIFFNNKLKIKYKETLKNKVNFIKYSDLEKKLRNLNGKYLISLSWRRYISDTITKNYKYAINIHPAILPEYKGIHPLPSVLKNNEKFHGMTAHLISNKIDSGSIILIKKYKINKFSTIESLQNLFYTNLNSFMIILFNKIIKEKNIKYLKNKKNNKAIELERTPKDSEIDPSKSLIKLYDEIRSAHQLKYPAYFIVNNQKVYITLSRRILFSRKNNKFDI